MTEDQKNKIVTLENKDGRRKVTVLNWNQIWAGQKAVAWMPLPDPFKPTEAA